MSIDKPVVTRKDMEDFASERLRKTPLSDMRLRDHFAGLAMQGWLSSYGPDMPHPAQNGSDIDAARNAYKLADAMLLARGE